MSELLSIVVPVYNEEATVGELIERLLAIELPVPREILVVNDGSTDGTRRVLDAFPAHGERFASCTRPQTAARARAIRTGLEQARGTIVAIQDADLEFDPAEIASLLTPILAARPRWSTARGSCAARQPALPWATLPPTGF